MSPSRPAPLRSAALGLCAGTIIGGLALGVKALLLAAGDCPEEMSAEACLLEAQLASELSKLFSVFALGLVLVGVGLGVLVRTRRPE